MLFPAGVRIRPLGIMVSPISSIIVYRSVAGAEAIQGSAFLSWEQVTSKIRKGKYFIKFLPPL